MPLGTVYEILNMANTYTQIHIQVVFAVKNRQSLIANKWKSELFKYMTAIIQNKTHKVLQINGVSDHVHILIGMRPTQSLSELIKQVKQSSSVWVNSMGYAKGKFAWQAGFGAFSYSKSEVHYVIDYIARQEEHHQKLSFHTEYKKLLRDFQIEFRDEYLFTSIE